MVSCIPCGGDTSARSNLNSCYPHSKELVAAGPDYKPLSQELSKLVSFARSKPSQLTKIGEELESRISKEARGSTGGYAKSRASLLVSLSILKTLIVECSHDLSLFSRSALRAMVSALDVKVYQKGSPDHEVVGRATSCFTAFATYTDGTPLSADKGLAKDYLSILARVGRMAVEADEGVTTTTEKPGPAPLGQARLIGLTALRGASGSDALFSSDTDTNFTRQVEIIVPALLSTLFGADMEDVKSESARVHQDPSSSPFFSEFTARRPVNDRRAPSIHGQMLNEKGQKTENALGSALRALKALMSRSQLKETSIILDVVFACMDKRGWTDVERSCWLADALTRFADLQFRSVIPSRLVEQLALTPDTAPTAKQSTLLAMISTILNSSIPLVGLGVSDVLNHLLTLIIRRIHIDERDSLLPPLVQCVSSLSANIHYADQINVMTEEISQRLTEISPVDKHRSEIMRVLVHCMIGVLTVVHAADDRESARNPPKSPISADKGKGPQIDTPLELAPVRQLTKRRNLVAPQVWQDTLTLLCESSYAVRSVYARALLLFLQREMPRETGAAKGNDLSVEMFCNALHAALYTLAMSACLGIGTSHGDDTPVESHLNSPVRNTDSRLPIINGENTGKGVSFNIVEPTPSATPNTTATPPNGQSTPPRESRRQFRRVSLPLNRLNSSNFIPLASFDNVATPLDFAYIVRILDTLHDVVPATALLTGGPMLFALDAAAGMELVRRPGDGRSGAWVLERKRGVREAVGLVWRGVGRKWGIDIVENLADKALSALPEPYVIPNLYPPENSDTLPAPDEPLSFTKNITEGESSSATQPLLDTEVITSALASSGQVQKATHKDAAGIVKRLGAGWSIESALMNSIERFSSTDTDSHFNTANTLMSNSNPSYRSFINNNQMPPNRAVGVADLRDALNQSHRQPQGTSAAPSIVSTLGTGGRSFIGDANGHGTMNGTSMGSGRKEDVREVLKDIFRDKKRAGGAVKGLTEAQKAVVA